MDPFPGELLRPATRYPYVFAFSNPQRYTDPTGRDTDAGLTPEDEFAAWYRSTHGGRDPSPNKTAMLRAAYGHKGMGMRGEWTLEGWRAYEELIGLLGALRYQFNECTASEDFEGATRDRMATEGLYIEYMHEGRLPPGHQILASPDGTKIIINGFIPEGAGAWAVGNIITLPRTTWEDESERGFTMIHEYVHVLQWRREGRAMERRYLNGGAYDWQNNRYEVQDVEIERHYRAHPELPDPWHLATEEWR